MVGGKSWYVVGGMWYVGKSRPMHALPHTTYGIVAPYTTSHMPHTVVKLFSCLCISCSAILEGRWRGSVKGEGQRLKGKGSRLLLSFNLYTLHLLLR